MNSCGKMGTKNARLLDRCWVFFLPFYFLVAAAFDSTEVTNGEYLKFILSTRHTAPENWSQGRYPTDKENDPVVLVNFHDAAAYCRWIGRRLPKVDEWKAMCEGGKLKKRGDIWEWTSTGPHSSVSPRTRASSRSVDGCDPTVTMERSGPRRTRPSASRRSVGPA